MMKKPMEAYEAFEVVLVPFPFIDTQECKRRPALIVSSAKFFNKKSKACVMTMITTASHNPWPLDVKITNLNTGGLPVPSIIRMKFFTLDERLILKKLGYLDPQDRESFLNNVQKLLNLAL